MAQRRPQRRPGGQRPRSGPRRATPTRRPAPPPTEPAPPATSPSRRAVERRSAAVLVYLRALPRFVVPLVLVGLAIGGLVWSGPGAFVLLVLVALFLTWLVYLSWPVLTAAPRAIRVVAILVILAGACYRLTG